MKRNLTFVMLAITALLAGCSKEQKAGTQTFSVTVDLVAADNVTIPENTTFVVTASNFDTKQELTQEASEGKAVFSGLIAGKYTFMTSVQITEDGKTRIYSGAMTNVNILKDEELEMKIDVAESPALLIKELYYSCSKTSANKPYTKEQFYEIYNNSDETVYVDGLCFGHLMPENATGKSNYDWGAEYPLTDWVFFARIMQIPGTHGQTEDYPVGPGESIILCQWATDHTVADLNPSSIDLSSCEFEWYEPTNTAQTDGSAINLKLAYPINPSSPYKTWVLTTNGPAFAIFFPEEEFSTDKVITDNNNKVSQTYPIPASIVIDAVETIKDETQVQFKRVPSSLDAGYIWVVDDEGNPAVQVGKSVVRKVLSTKEDGRAILQDTNNTTNDFEVKTREIRRYGAKAPSWNTWAE